MAALECNNTTGSFNNSSAENGEALPEEKSLSIDYSEDLWLANSEDSSGPYAQQTPNSKTTASDVAVISSGSQSLVAQTTFSRSAPSSTADGAAQPETETGTVVAEAEVPVTNYQPPSQQQWSQMGEPHHPHEEDEEGGTVLQPSAATATYLNGSLEQNGMEPFNSSSGDEKDFAQLVPAGTYVESSATPGSAADPQDKTFTALMPAAGLGVNGEEMQGGFTTMLQGTGGGGGQQMVFYGSGEQVGADSSQMIPHHGQAGMAYEHSASASQLTVMDSQDGSAASGGEEGAGEGSLYVAMDGVETNNNNGHQHVSSQAENFALISPTVLSNMENVKLDNAANQAFVGSPAGGNFQNISTLPFVQNGAFPSNSSFSNFPQSGIAPSQTDNFQGNGVEEAGSQLQDQSAIGYDQEEGNSDNSNMAEASEFTCQICQEGFEDQASLEGHMENHPPMKSFVCETCNKSFATRRYLKYHRKNHCRRAGSYEGRSESEEAYPNAEVKRFSCNFCNRPFRVLKCMKVHKKKKHGVLKDFTCPNCAITFASSQQLIEHGCQPKSPLPPTGQEQPHQQQPQQPVTPVVPGAVIQPPGTPVNMGVAAGGGGVAAGGVGVAAGGGGPGSGGPPPYLSQRKKKKLRQAKPTCDICGKIFGDRISLDIHRVKHIEEEFFPCDMCAVDTQSDNPTHVAVHFRIKFFTDDNQHILEDQKAAAEAMRVEDGTPGSGMGSSPIHGPSTPNPNNPSHHHHHHPHHPHHPHSHSVPVKLLTSTGATVYSNPSSIIATAAACTNIINHTQDGGVALDGGQYLDQAGALGAAAVDAGSEYSSQSVKIETAAMLSNYSPAAIAAGQSPLVSHHHHQQQQMNNAATPPSAASSFTEFSQEEGMDVQQHQQQQQQLQQGEGGGVTTKAVVRAKPHLCDICNKSFAEPAKLELHYKSNHLEDRPFQCDVCDKSFFTKWKLQRHMLSHLETKPHSCPACSKSFVERGKLEAHYRTHLGTKPFKCEHCDKAFTVKSQLTIHVRRIHSADQPFGCEVCGKAFLWKSGLEKHMRKHTREKPHGCGHCGQKYSQKSNLISHLAKAHNEHHHHLSPASAGSVQDGPQQPQE